MITAIPSVNVLEAWERVADHVKAAVEHVETGYNEEDILTRIMTKDMQLWVVGENEAAAVTQIQVFPRHKSLVIVALGGSGLSEWFEELMETLEAWGQAMGCKFCEAYGREGWVKAAKPLGYEKAFTIVRKTL